jgi:hypothetical protein
MAVTPVSFRTLVAGSGTITAYYIGGKPWRLVFSQAQHFYKGECVAAPIWHDGSAYVWGPVTVDFGYGTEWQTTQKGNANSTSSGTWRRTDPSSSRARGGAWAGMKGVVPGAWHFLYVSPFDASGNRDWYTYVDTIYPQNGKHPYTKDPYSGRCWLADEVNVYADPAKLTPDIGNRLADLDALPPVAQL